jgi:hypothetical protein
MLPGSKKETKPLISRWPPTMGRKSSCPLCAGSRSSCTSTRGTTRPAARARRAKSHAKFRDKFELNFPLLCDTDHKVAEEYGAWREKNMYGKISMGIQRSTFLIDAEGRVAKAWKF